jgi:hypothetical protein
MFGSVIQITRSSAKSADFSFFISPNCAVEMGIEITQNNGLS